MHENRTRDSRFTGERANHYTKTSTHVINQVLLYLDHLIVSLRNCRATPVFYEWVITE